MITITIKSEVNTHEDVCIMMEHIMELIRQGYTRGHEPTWELSGEEEPEDELEEEEP